jgi:hypothetical protein
MAKGELFWVESLLILHVCLQIRVILHAFYRILTYSRALMSINEFGSGEPSLNDFARRLLLFNQPPQSAKPC